MIKLVRVMLDGQIVRVIDDRKVVRTRRDKTCVIVTIAKQLLG